jgi:hypothetical protein
MDHLMTYLDRARAIPDYTGSERAKCRYLKGNGVTDGEGTQAEEDQARVGRGP